MGNENKLGFCRYYKGEKQFPAERLGKLQHGFLFWEAEYTYVNSTDIKFEQDVINSYLSLVGASTGLEIPLLLCAILFAIYCKNSDLDPQYMAATFEMNILTPYIK